MTARAGIQVAFYVSPAGDDQKSGLSGSAAFQTIAKARDAVRSVNQNMTGDILVYLMDGTFRLDKTVTFGPMDSGNNGYSVIYQAFPGTHPIVTGSENLSGGWTLHDPAGNIYRKTGISGLFRQLYVGNSRAIRARAPNWSGIGTGGPYYKALNTAYPYSVNASEIGTWARNGVCEFVWLAHWNQRRGRISNYTVSGSSATLTFQAPENGFKISANTQNPTYYYFENAYELLDAGGEWFLDFAAATLYYKPRAGEDMTTAEILAPKVERLFDFVGTETAPVQAIQLSGITFCHDNWTAPSSYGFVDGQGGQAIKTGLYAGTYEQFSPASAMVFLTYTNTVRVERCTFTLGGSWGISEALGSHHNSYVGNNFSSLASGAIVLGNIAATGYWWDFPAGSSAGDLVSNNLVDNVSCDYRDNVGIMALKCRDTTIEHNEIRNLPYTGISLGFEWNNSGTQSCRNNLVRFNRVHKVMGLMDDGGGIYTLGSMPDSFFSGNFIHSLAASPYSAGSPNGYGNAGIYLDNGSTYKTVDSNVVDRAGSSFLAYDGSLNTGRNNFYNCPLNTITKFTTWTNNTNCQGAAWPPAALAIMNEAGIQPPYRDIGAVTCGANVAVGGAASSSSLYSSTYPASKGNDNNGTSGLWASNTTEQNPWWQVDLGNTHRIYEVEIVARQDFDQSSTRKNFAIQASNDSNFSTYTTLDSDGNYEVFHHKGIYSKSVTNPNLFRYVRIQRINNAGHFNFAECRVFGIPLTHLQAWRQKYFQTTAAAGIAADTSDDDADGFTNLMEFALGTNPTIPDATLPAASVDADGADTFLTLSVPRTAIQPEITYIVEISDNLDGWSDNVTILENSPTLLKARDNIPSRSANTRFIRLRVTTP